MSASDKDQIKARLVSELDTLIRERLPDARKNGTEYRAGSLEGGKGSSLSIETAGDDAGRFQDFADESIKGDVFDLYSTLLGWPSPATAFPEVLKAARAYLGMPEPGPNITFNGQPASSNGQPAGTTHKATNAKPARPEPAEPEPVPGWLPAFLTAAAAELAAGATPEAQKALEYLQGRSLPPGQSYGVAGSTVSMPAHFSDWYKRNVRGRLLIIYRNELGHPVYYTARDLTGKATKEHKYLKPAGVKASIPYNGPAALQEAKKRGTLYITEGELDAISLQTAYGKRHPVIGCSGGTMPEAWHDHIATAGCEVLILADNDDDGNGLEKAEKLQAKLAGLNGTGPVRVLQLKDYKDANEVLTAEGPAGLVQRIEDAAQAARTAGISDYLYITETWLAEINARADRPHSHYTTGLPELDKLLGGGYLEGLHLLGGITGGGKTSLALSIAMHNALAGRTVIYGSYEQSRLELWARIAARITGIPQRAIKAGTYDDRGRAIRTADMLKEHEHWPKLQQLSKHLKVVEGGDAFSRQAGEWSVNTLASTAREVMDLQGSPPLIIIDYLQRMPPPPDVQARDTRDRIGAVAGSLQTMLGRGSQAPVLALSSVGRASYNAEKFAKEPVEERLQAFKEAGELEYTSYTALTLYALPHSKQGEQMTPARNLHNQPTFLPRVLDLVKNREGKTGRLAVKWKPWADEWDGAINYGKDKDAL